MTDITNIFVNGNNFGNIAGRDIIIQASQSPSWIERRNIINKVIHHFKIFFSLANYIKSRKISNPFQDCKTRMKREFDMNEISVLEMQHQKDIYEMHNHLMELKNANECTSELQERFNKKLIEISNHYMP